MIHTASKATAHLWIEEPLDKETEQGPEPVQPAVRHASAARRADRGAAGDVGHAIRRRPSHAHAVDLVVIVALVVIAPSSARRRRASVRAATTTQKAAGSHDDHDGATTTTTPRRVAPLTGLPDTTRHVGERPRADGEDRQHPTRRTAVRRSTRPTSSTKRSSRAASRGSPRSSTRRPATRRAGALGAQDRPEHRRGRSAASSRTRAARTYAIDSISTAPVVQTRREPAGDRDVPRPHANTTRRTTSTCIAETLWAWSRGASKPTPPPPLFTYRDEGERSSATRVESCASDSTTDSTRR